MNITDRLFSYPILSSEKNDYDNSAFEVNLDYKMNGVNNIKLNFSISTNNDEINELINLGLVEYLIHLECSTTSYRTAIHTISMYETVEIPIGRLNGKLEVVVLIVAKEPIKNFVSKDWNEDYEGLSFDISKGNILGYENLPPIDIVKGYEELSNASSIFTVYKRLTNEPKPIDVNIDSSLIKIGLGTNEYDIYSRFCKKTQFQPILNSMLVFPSLVYVFEELKQESGIEANSGKVWFISLEKAYEKRGVNFIEEICDEEKTSIQLAQEAMELPLSDAFATLSELFESADEEEL